MLLGVDVFEMVLKGVEFVSVGLFYFVMYVFVRFVFFDCLVVVLIVDSC